MKRVFERMKIAGVEPDEVTFRVIVNGLSKSGRLEEAMEYFEFCRDNNMAVNVSLMILERLGGLMKLINFLKKADRGCTWDSYCYNALIDAFAKSAKIDEALVLFKRMEGEGCDQTYTYAILISGLFKEHRNEETLKLWDIMIAKGIISTAASVRALSIGLSLSGKVARARKVLDELAQMGIIPEAAFENMINVLCKAIYIEQACKLADGIVERGQKHTGESSHYYDKCLEESTECRFGNEVDA